jgi:hypothetical protein
LESSERWPTERIQRNLRELGLPKRWLSVSTLRGNFADNRGWAADPSRRLRSLMEEHGLRQRDLLDVFGSRGIASEVVSGKRAISKAPAEKLAALFHVGADLFL